MPDTDAQTLDNFVCETGYVRLQRRIVEFTDIGSGTALTLDAFKNESGAEKFLAIGTDNKFWQIDTGTAVDRSATYDATAAQTYSRWITCVYRHRLFGCNHTDRPFAWTGVGDVTVAGWTGPASNAVGLQSVQPYKSRLYFTEINNASYWYTSSVDVITGALTEVPLDSLLHRGGYPVFVGSSSARTGQVTQELFVIYTTEGEVLIYQGRYPGDATWGIVARYLIPKPADIKCHVYIDNKLYLFTSAGPIGIHELLGGVSALDPFALESGKVRQAFIDSFIGFSSTSVGFYSAVNVPTKNYTVFNVYASGSGPHQYVMNNTTKAWSRWKEVNARSMAVFNDKLYIASVSSAGKIYEIDAALASAPTGATNWDLKHSSNFLGNAKSSKKVTLVQPLFSVEKQTGSEATDSLRYFADFDLEPTPAGTFATANFQVTSSTSKFNKPILPLVGEGRSVALWLQDSPSTVYDFRYYGSWVQVEDAGGLA